jgi:hypothetical protein
MPRLNNRTYYDRYLLARDIWHRHQGRYGDLSYQQQRDIHDYYRPSDELAEAELVEHRKQITPERPTLPARASKAFKALVAPDRQPGGIVHTISAKRAIRVRAVIQPHPNIKQLARALVSLAEDMARSEMAAKGRNRPSTER